MSEGLSREEVAKIVEDTYKENFTSSELKKKIASIPALLKKYTYPLEDAIHDFSVELLRGLQSAYILDNEAQVNKLKSEVADAIKTLRNYSGPGAEEAHEILFQQLKKQDMFCPILITILRHLFNFLWNKKCL